MGRKWCYNGKTGEIFSYEQSDNLTDFPRGMYLAYDDYLVTDIKNFREARKIKKEWGICHKCKSTRASKKGEKCFVCKEILV